MSRSDDAPGHVFDAGALTYPPDEPEEKEVLGVRFKRVPFDRIYEKHWVTDTVTPVRIFPPPHSALFPDDHRWLVLVEGEPIKEFDGNKWNDPEAELDAFRTAATLASK